MAEVSPLEEEKRDFVAFYCLCFMFLIKLEAIEGLSDHSKIECFCGDIFIFVIFSNFLSAFSNSIESFPSWEISQH